MDVSTDFFSGAKRRYSPNSQRLLRLFYRAICQHHEKNRKKLSIPCNEHEENDLISIGQNTKKSIFKGLYLAIYH